jgi:hypothetical protein
MVYSATRVFAVALILYSRAAALASKLARKKESEGPARPAHGSSRNSVVAEQ